MDWNLILNYVLKIVGSVGASLIVTYASILFAKLKTKIQDAKVTAYVKQAVQAAEQMFPNEGKKMGKEKYAYVVEQTLTKFPNLTENEYLKSLIEGAVYTVSQQVKQIANATVQAEQTTQAPTLSSF